MAVEHFQNASVSLEALSDILQEINPEYAMKAQAINQKINNPNAIKFLKRIFETVLRRHLRVEVDKIPLEIFADFNNVYLQDSTCIELYEKLAEEFKGSGGSASKAGLKIDLLYEIRSHITKDILISKATIPDQKRSSHILNHIQKNDLVIRDMGYFVIDVFRKIADRKAYYLSRCSPRNKIFLSNDEEAEAINLGEYFKKNMKGKNLLELDVFLGDKEKLPCRLIVYRLPEKEVNERKRKEKKKAKKQKRQLTETQLAVLEYGLYITNVSREIFSVDIVGTIYRTRWQIELIFKQWKQLFQIHVMRGTRSERIYCLVYSRLTMIIIATSIFAITGYYTITKYDREISPEKSIQWLKRNRRMQNAIFSNRLGDLIDISINSAPNCMLKQVRKRKTTRELLQEKVPFLDSFYNTDKLKKLA